MRDLKTFDDLEFNVRESTFGNCKPDMHATMEFSNGWGVSVVTSTGSGGMGSVYGCLAEGTYELAVTFGGRLNYVNPVARGDIRAWIDKEAVTFLMTAVQSFNREQGTYAVLSWTKQWDRHYRERHSIED